MTLDRVNTSLEEVARQARRVSDYQGDVDQAREMLTTAMKRAYGPHTLQEIGDAAGLSRERVRQLLKGEK